MKPELGVLLGTSEFQLEKALRVMLERILGTDYKLTCTVSPTGTELRREMTSRAYDLIVFWTNTIVYVGAGCARFDLALELVRLAKQRKRTALITLATWRPPDFAPVEQAGADAHLDAPFLVADLGKAVRAALEASKKAAGVDNAPDVPDPSPVNST